MLSLAIGLMLERRIYFFSSAVGEDLGRMISDMLGFQIVENFGYYLGVPLFHEKFIKSTLRFVVEKVRNKLQS